ncbi:MAG TPA: hypothetical protein VKA51_04120, partial [Rubrobacteraceae bacterium]|nr:hypothetical protein [Rubrobacteraceae bacterium]
MQATSEVRAGPVAEPIGIGAQVLGAIGIAAIFMGLFGVYWDVGHHATLGRESFWIPPHLLIYAGTALFFCASLCGLLLTCRRARSFRAALAARAGQGFVVAMLGSIVQVSAAPLDDLWHRLYGLDVTVWSPPHLMGVAGALVGIYGMTCALGAGVPRGERRGTPTIAEVNVVLLFAAALSLSTFAFGRLDFRLEMRDALFYPLLAGPLAAIPLVAAARYVGRFGAATAVALVYTVFRFVALQIFVGMGAFENPAPPIFLLAPALAVDLALPAMKGRGVLLAALVFGPALVFGEWAFRATLDISNWEPLEVIASVA